MSDKRPKSKLAVRRSRRPQATVLLTGATGFIGKVTLLELLRRREQLGIAHIVLAIRPRSGATAGERFRRELVESPAFARLPLGWEAACQVVSADLESPRAVTRIPHSVTHLIHCATSATASSSLRQALATNVTTGLGLLELAQGCAGFVRMVSLSTAYVSPHRSTGAQAVDEALVELDPAPLRALLPDGAVAGSAVNPSLYESLYEWLTSALEQPPASVPVDLRLQASLAERLLRATGHPNLYTATLWLAERLLASRRQVALTLVRPSIVSACEHQPAAGWLDGQSPFAAFVALAGSGRFRQLVARPDTVLDVVPCDEVATTLVDAAFARASVDLSVVHAVAGLRQSMTVAQICSGVLRYFQGCKVGSKLDVQFIAPESLPAAGAPWQRWVAASGGARLQQWSARLPYLGRRRRATQLLRQQLDKLNRSSSFFTTHTYDFATSRTPHARSAEKYLRTICSGVFRHRLRGDDTQLSLAGRLHREGRSDLLFTASQPAGNPVIRSTAYWVQKALRRATDRVTFDKAAFDAAMADRPEGALLVLVPSHRSFMDFVVCSYLFFARSDLGIAIPYIAAAEEFQRIPLLGKLFPYAHAFYVKRGQGKADQSLTKQVHSLVDKGCTMQFFIEGARSRSRRFLPPRRGMLRALQGTEQLCVLLPVALTYDRVPDEALLLRELRGQKRPPFALSALMAWLGKVMRGQVQLGRFHIGCGPLLTMDASTDVKTLSLRIIEELQRHTATTTHHLRAFVESAPALRIDVAWLRREIERRGGRVLDSPLRGERGMDPLAERTLRNNWLHHFYPEAAALYPDDAAIAAHLARNGYGFASALRSDITAEPRPPMGLVESSGASSVGDRDPSRVATLVHALFEPIRRDYQATLDCVATHPGEKLTAAQIVRDRPELYLPDVEDALASLSDGQSVSTGPNATDRGAARVERAGAPRGDVMPATAAPRQ